MELVESASSEVLTSVSVGGFDIFGAFELWLWKLVLEILKSVQGCWCLQDLLPQKLIFQKCKMA